MQEHLLILHYSCWFHALLGSFLPHGLLHAHSLLYFLRFRTVFAGHRALEVALLIVLRQVLSV